MFLVCFQLVTSTQYPLFFPRAYSLERLVEDKYGGGGEPNRSSISIVPTNKLEREYQDNNYQQRRASREEIDQARTN